MQRVLLASALALGGCATGRPISQAQATGSALAVTGGLALGVTLAGAAVIAAGSDDPSYTPFIGTGILGAILLVVGLVQTQGSGITRVGMHEIGALTSGDLAPIWERLQAMQKEIDELRASQKRRGRPSVRARKPGH